MKTYEEHAEHRLNRLAEMAPYHQGAWMSILLLFLASKPYNIKAIGTGLAISALLASFVASRMYIYTGKKVEEFKRFSPDEIEKRKKEYMFRFFFPYLLWSG